MKGEEISLKAVMVATGVVKGVLEARGVLPSPSQEERARRLADSVDLIVRSAKPK